MNDPMSRPDVIFSIVWNPNTGTLDLKFDGANKMEAIGVFQFAIAALVNAKPDNRIVPAGPIMPHLIKQ